MKEIHLVVLVHGIWGNLSHMDYLADQIQRKCIPEKNSETLIVHKTGCHSGYLTCDGIDVNGKRISDEIVATADSFSTEGSKVVKFSLIGYSLGGLVCRYALGILYNDGFFEKIEPVHFVTFCTPHVGVLNPGKSLSSRVYNFIAPYVLASTGSQLFLTDRKVVGEKEYLPLLQWMADPASKFYKALLLFSSRTLYANAINDRRTSWYTAFVSGLDPFNSMVNETLSAYSLQYISGYEPTIVDFSKPIEFNKVSREAPAKFSPGSLAYKGYVWLKVVASLVFIAPLYSLYVVFNSIHQRVKMSIRLKQFARESADSLKTLYEATAIDDLVSSSYAVIERDNDSDKDEIANFSDRFQDQTEMFVDSIYNALNSASYYDYHYSVVKSSKAVEEKKPILEPKAPVTLKGKLAVANFKVNLTNPQEEIVKEFNKLSWNKYPVIIRNTKATHAAMIHRHDDPTFKEGKLVVNHFVTHVFTV